MSQETKLRKRAQGRVFVHDQCRPVAFISSTNTDFDAFLFILQYVNYAESQKIAREQSRVVPCRAVEVCRKVQYHLALDSGVGYIFNESEH